MPRMNGIERLEVIHEEFSIELPRVILCNTQNGSDRIIAATQADTRDRITTPFNADITAGRMNDVAMPSEDRT